MYYLGHIHKSGFKRRDAFRISLLVTIAVFIYQFFQLQQGDWIYYTIAFAYMGGVVNGLAMQRVIKRFYWAPVGYFAGFLFMGLFSYFDYRLTYLLPIFVVVGFWYFFVTGEYGIFVMFFLLFLMLFYDITASSDTDINMYNLIFSRTFNTAIGGLLVVFGELLIFPHSNSALRDSETISRNILKHLGTVLTSIIEHAEKSIKLKHGYWNELSYINSELVILRSVIDSYKQEPESSEKKLEALENLYSGAMKIYDGVRIMELSCNFGADKLSIELKSLSSKLAEELISPDLEKTDTIGKETLSVGDNYCSAALGQISEKIRSCKNSLKFIASCK